MLAISIEEHEIRIGPRLAITFHRTLRIPDDGLVYPLPPGLGPFPVFRVEDYLDRVPPSWRERGGAFIPMYQREALWLGFNGAPWKPNAVKICVGGVNAISGGPLRETLSAPPQDYIVCPNQPWLDGINTGHETIRQFIAMPLGLGYTVEASLTGAEKFGGLQITVFEPKPGKFPDAPPPAAEGGPKPCAMAGAAMGLGAGGVMRQKIYPDPYGIETWDRKEFGSVTVHILNSEQFLELTGIEPPPTAVDAKTYTKHGLPWFALYDETKEDIEPPEAFKDIETVAEKDEEFGASAEKEESVEVPKEQIREVKKKDPGRRKPPPTEPGFHSPEDE